LRGTLEGKGMRFGLINHMLFSAPFHNNASGVAGICYGYRAIRIDAVLSLVVNKEISISDEICAFRFVSLSCVNTNKVVMWLVKETMRALVPYQRRMAAGRLERRSKKPVRMYILKNDCMQIGEVIHINQKIESPFPVLCIRTPEPHLRLYKFRYLVFRAGSKPYYLSNRIIYLFKNLITYISHFKVL
jgi:hypothetical protein